MLNEIRLDVGTENPPEITPGRYSSLIFRIRRVFEGNNREKNPLWKQVGEESFLRSNLASQTAPLG